MSNDENAIHFGAIRQAFSNNNAAVMVGAGFSRNAEGGDSLATWPMVGKALWEALNPDTKEAVFSTGMVTQLGEQYARVFSVPALENLLKQLIPDDKVAPGLLHDQLLKLPWSEIFTTNYDTLLERAAEKILDRAHFTVASREDIPLSKILDRRRIVKLHGSFLR
ncbi:MAG: SIR2 family protein [Pseudomonadota bacterium]